MKVLLASPVQQNPEILELFLYCIQRVKRSAGVVVHYFFIDDNERAESSALLQQFQASHPHTRLDKHRDHIPYVVDERTHHWTQDHMDRVAKMKDEIIQYAIEADYDYLWLVDSDLLLHPDTLVNLLQADKDIISCIFWTQWDGYAAPMPQVWLSDQYSMVRPRRAEKNKETEEVVKFLAQLRQSGVYEVGGLGACTLISRAALLKGVCFKTIENISLIGEDRHFCVRAAALGFKLYVDTRSPAYHIYRPADMEGGYKFIETLDLCQ